MEKEFESSLAARWALSRRLRSLRHDADTPVATVSDALGISRARWSQVENDHAMIAEKKIDDLAELFNVPTEAESLKMLRRVGSRRSDWWFQYEDLLPQDLLKYYGLEHEASSISAYSATVVNGLLQTEDYAMALIAGSPDVSEFERSSYLRIRQQRQKLLLESKLELQAVFSEAALMFDLGSKDLLQEQLEHLLNLIEDSRLNLELRVLPFTSPAISVTGASTFHILDFESAYLDPVVWEEGSRIIGLSEDRDLVDLKRLGFKHAVDNSLNDKASVLLIEKRLKELRI